MWTNRALGTLGDEPTVEVAKARILGPTNWERAGSDVGKAGGARPLKGLERHAQRFHPVADQTLEASDHQRDSEVGPTVRTLLALTRQ